MIKNIGSLVTAKEPENCNFSIKRGVGAHFPLLFEKIQNDSTAKSLLSHEGTKITKEFLRDLRPFVAKFTLFAMDSQNTFSVS
jgi:hypothetical protein